MFDDTTLEDLDHEGTNRATSRKMGERSPSVGLPLPVSSATLAPETAYYYPAHLRDYEEP